MYYRLGSLYRGEIRYLTYKIKILDRLEYEKPEPINFDELEIDQTFISEKGYEIEKNDSIKNSDEEDYKNLQFIIK